MSNHGWDEAALRIPAGALGGGLIFWLFGELIAWPLRRAGRDFWAGVGRFWPFMARASLWRGAAAVWLVLLVGFGVGLYVYATRAWPYPIVQQLEAWFRGEGNTTLGEKLANDLDIVPSRHLVTVDFKAPATALTRAWKACPSAPAACRPNTTSPRTPPGCTG
ncbi:MAG: hypothetical protein KKH66_04315 [Proteobacteria bacterium]|nr:hypothetical protein [Pseudomonadota bacterium]